MGRDCLAVADCNRTAPKLWLVRLFDRRIARVHVDVDDLVQRHNATISSREQKVNSGRDWPRISRVGPSGRQTSF